MLTLHLFAMAFSVVVVFAADKEALAWVRGKKHTLNRGRMRIYHVLTWMGLIALIVTGILLMMPMISYLLTQPLFVIKLLFVGILVVNAILIGRLMDVAVERPFASLSAHERAPLLTSGAVSSFGWIAAVILAFVVFK